jgi:hypothetical protein
MNITNFINLLARSELQIFRVVEKLEKKLSKCGSAIIFNQVCLREQLLPNYTDFRLHNSALRDAPFTVQFRKSLLEDQLQQKTDERSKLITDYNAANNDFVAVCRPDICEQYQQVLYSTKEREDEINLARISRKLNALYNGNLLLPEANKTIYNLTDLHLTDDQEEVLKLGLNYHLNSKFDSYIKKVQLELVYQQLVKLEKDKVVSLVNDIEAALIAESNKNRGSYSKPTLSRQQWAAIKELKENKDVVIRKADKSNNYVLLRYCDYKRKLDDILSDTNKFSKLTADPTKDLKRKLNKIITTINSASNSLKLKKLEGHYSPGYIYGNPKIHKNQIDPPLRPIISQIPTPTYEVAKAINKLIVPFMPAQYLLNSTDEFVQLIRSKKPSGIVASLDVESLFTNVPVETTIDIIVHNVYNHPTLAKPDISATNLTSLLKLCTTEAPFQHIDGTLYYQKDGIAMGSPLGPTFANYYMCHIENQALEDSNIKPYIYCRYIDDIFVDVGSEQQLRELQQKMQELSVLNFTYELNVFNKLPFLDVLIECANSEFKTSVYTKPTNTQECLNYDSDAPHRYKEGLINTLLNRAFKICSNWESLHTEIERIKQMLVNNNYPNKLIESKIRTFLHKRHVEDYLLHTQDTTSEDSSAVEQIRPTIVKIYYQNQMSQAYTDDERSFKKILKEHVIPVKETTIIQPLIYYKNRKISNFLIRNNTCNSNKDKCDKHNVVYQFKCNEGECKSLDNTYIGFTTMTLKDRLYQHKYQGSIHRHFNDKHSIKPSKDILQSNTTILYNVLSKSNISIFEALHIYNLKPTINDNISNFSSLQLFNRRVLIDTYT